MLKEIITEDEHYFEDEKGLLQGEYLHHHDNRVVCAKGFYRNGKREGRYLWYYNNGRIGKKCFFKDDKLNGEYLLYHLSGELEEKSFYKNDKRISEDEYKLVLINKNLKRIK